MNSVSFETTVSIHKWSLASCSAQVLTLSTQAGSEWLNGCARIICCSVNLCVCFLESWEYHFCYEGQWVSIISCIMWFKIINRQFTFSLYNMSPFGKPLGHQKQWYPCWINFKDIFPPNQKILKCFYCYDHQLTYQNTTFTHYLEDWSSFSVVFIAPYLMHHSVILWNSPSMFCVNMWKVLIFAMFWHFCWTNILEMEYGLTGWLDLNLWPSFSIS